MSGHADTIREAITRHYTRQQADDALTALDALLAENQRLREALHRRALNDALQRGVHYEAAVEEADEDVARIIKREALAGEDDT